LKNFFGDCVIELENAALAVVVDGVLFGADVICHFCVVLTLLVLHKARGESKGIKVRITEPPLIVINRCAQQQAGHPILRVGISLASGVSV